MASMMQLSLITFQLMATSQTTAAYTRAASVTTDHSASGHHAQAFENLAKKLYRLESKIGMQHLINYVTTPVLVYKL